MEVYVNDDPKLNKLDVVIHTPSDSSLKLKFGECVAGSFYKMYAGPFGPLRVQQNSNLKPVATADKSDITNFARKMAGNPEFDAKVAARRAELEAESVDQIAKEQIATAKKEAVGLKLSKGK